MWCISEQERKVEAKERDAIASQAKKNIGESMVVLAWPPLISACG